MADCADRLLLGGEAEGPARRPLLVAGLLAPGAGDVDLRCELVAKRDVSFYGERMELVVATPAYRGERAGEELEFRVVLDKTTGRMLGARLKVHHDEDDAVEITEVIGDLIQQWNEDHPELAVRRGDRIVEVNGIRHGTTAWRPEKEWWTQNEILELVVARRIKVPAATELDVFSAELSGSLHDRMVKSCTWLWPLHDRAADAELKKAALSHLVEDGVELDSIPVAKRVLARLFILMPPGGSLVVKLVRDVYGNRSAYAIFWGWIYAQQLWILAAIAAVALAFQTVSVRLAGEVMNYGTLLWSVWLLRRIWSHNTVIGIGGPRDGFGPSRVHDHLHDPGRSGVSSSCLNAVVLAFLTMLFACVVLSVTLGYLQLVAYMTFEWDDCISLRCQSAGAKHELVDIVVGMLLDVGFAIVMVLLRAVARWFGHWAATWHNFEYAIDRKLVAKAYTMLVASVDTIGAFMLFGVLYVTPWPGSAQGDSSEMAGVDCSDALFYSVVGKNAFQCLNRRVSLDSRRAVYRRLMRSPLVVAPFVRILTKRVFPMAARRLNDHRVPPMGSCSCLRDVANACKRLLVFIFAFDADSVGGLKFVLAGDPWKGASALAAADGEQLAADALEELRLREFEPDDEVVEVKLSMLFVIMFAPIMPEGVFTTLLGRMIENWGDLAKLLFARRRPFPDHGTSIAAMHAEVKGFLASAVAVKAIWSLVLSFVVFSDE